MRVGAKMRVVAMPLELAPLERCLWSQHNECGSRAAKQRRHCAAPRPRLAAETAAPRADRERQRTLRRPGARSLDPLPVSGDITGWSPRPSPSRAAAPATAATAGYAQALPSAGERAVLKPAAAPPGTGNAHPRDGGARQPVEGGRRSRIEQRLQDLKTGGPHLGCFASATRKIKPSQEPRHHVREHEGEGGRPRSSTGSICAFLVEIATQDEPAAFDILGV